MMAEKLKMAKNIFHLSYYLETSTDAIASCFTISCFKIFTSSPPKNWFNSKLEIEYLKHFEKVAKKLRLTRKIGSQFGRTKYAIGHRNKATFTDCTKC